jgi:two-component system response regulator HydG
MNKLRILILYPESGGLALLTSMLKSLGLVIEEANNDRMAVRLMERNNIDLVLAGVEPAEADALELLMYVRRKHRAVPVILLFPRLHPERAKEALRMGAMAVLKYPVPAAELRAAVLQALEHCETRSPEPTPGSMAAPAASPATPAHLRPHLAQPTAGTATAELPSRPAIAPVPFTPHVAASVSPPAAMPSPSAQRVEQIARELGLHGQDPSWKQVLDLAATLAQTRSSVLILGEPGTGKSLLAKLIHSLGQNPDRPFVTVETAQMAQDDDEPDSDGGIPLATPTAPMEWSNQLNQARGGTLYLDEIAALPVELQIQLMRELQFRDYEAASGHTPVLGDTRFVMSTSENLLGLIDQGRFRRELYHRASVISIMLPPLRHRGTDIELLAEAFRAHYTQEFHKPVVGFTRDALDVLQRHDWPGNIRELEAAIQRAVALCNGPRITSSHLSPILNHHRQARAGAGANAKPHLHLGIRPLKEALEEPEKRIIIQALQAFNWNRQETARVLDINRTTLYKKMKKYGILIDELLWAN